MTPVLALCALLSALPGLLALALLLSRPGTPPPPDTAPPTDPDAARSRAMDEGFDNLMRFGVSERK